MSEKEVFNGFMRLATYNMLYNALLEMGAGAAALKAFESYKKAELQDIQTAGAWVREWQQAKVSEMIKENFLLSEKQRKQQEDLFSITVPKKETPS